MNENLSPRSCEVCGKDIAKPSYPMSVAQWDRRRYCSRKCFGKGYSERFNRQQDRTCEACGKAYRPNHFGRKYCSSECAKGRYENRRGSKNWAWKGGRHVDASGYVHVWLADDHVFAAMRHNGRYVLEHRLVMAEHFGRSLERHETVHHINGDRSDNRLENLQLRNGRHGKGRKLVCSDCGSENIREVAL